MSLLRYPDPRLNVKCEPVGIDEDVSELIGQMLSVAREHDALGLAANQIGVLKRVFLMRVGGFEIVCINPEIIKRCAAGQVFIEGCLSLPGKKVRTKRSKNIQVRYVDREGYEIEASLSGLDAVLFQHELDHLNGKTMLDRQFAGRA